MDTSDFNLSDDQLAKLNQFQEVCGLEDAQVSMATLASLDWDVERAIESFLSGGGGGGGAADDVVVVGERPAPHTLPIQPVNMHDNVNAVDMDEVIDSDDDGMTAFVSRAQQDFARRHAESADRVGGAVPFQPAAFEDYIRNMASMSMPMNGRARRAHDDMEVIPPSSSRHSAGATGGNSWSDDDDDDYVLDGHDEADDYGTNPRDDQVPLIPTDCDSIDEAIQNFISVFEARFGQNGPVPSFYTGSLQMAMREAFEAPHRGAEERRPLAVYLHHDRSVAANIFPTTVLCVDSIVQLLRAQYVLWPWDVTQKENETKLKDWMSTCGMSEIRRQLDMMAREKDKYPLLAILSREKGTIELVDVCYGNESVNDAMGKLMSGVEVFGAIRTAEMGEERERRERERVRTEQAREYEESLAADKARMEAKKEEARAHQEALEKEQREKEEEQMKLKLIESALPDEPAEGAGVLNIKFRLPGGEQLMRRFRPTETPAILFNYLHTKGFDKTKYKFFNSDFPKKDITTFAETSSFVDLNWPAREQIFVEEM